MPRPQRIQLKGTLQHVISRGNDQQTLFKDNADFTKYLSLLSSAQDQFGLKVYNYVLMSNHIHLLVEPTQDGSLSLVMEAVTKEYAKYFNKKYDRSGHVFQGRYKSYLVQTEKYYFACSRYIDLNPVKAHILEKPEEYKYSGYAALAFGKKGKFKLDEHDVYKELGKSAADKQLAYRTLVTSYQGEEIDPMATHGNIIGDREFKREQRKKNKTK